MTVYALTPTAMLPHPYASPSSLSLLHQVAYFYMPPNDGRPAELIEILNCARTYIHVPMREEDITLEAFYVRDMTEAEIHNFSGGQVWQIFVSWDELLGDHERYKVDTTVLSEIKSFRSKFPLSESMAA